MSEKYQRVMSEIREIRARYGRDTRLSELDDKVSAQHAAGAFVAPATSIRYMVPISNQVVPIRRCIALAVAGGNMVSLQIARTQAGVHRCTQEVYARSVQAAPSIGRLHLAAPSTGVRSNTQILTTVVRVVVRAMSCACDAGSWKDDVR